MNLETAKGLYKIVEKGLEKCDDPNDTPLFKREQYLEIKEMLDKADKTSDEILDIKKHVSKMVSEAIKTFDFDAMNKQAELLGLKEDQENTYRIEVSSESSIKPGESF